MSRIVMAGMPAAGHVNPSLPLMQELMRRDIQVTYYATEEFHDPIERTGAEFRPYPAGTLSASDIAEATRTGSAVRVVVRGLAATETLLPFLQAELHTPTRPNGRPQRPWPTWSARAAGPSQAPR